VEAGAKRAGRGLADVDVAVYVRTCVTDERGPVREALARDITGYAIVNAYPRFFEACGFAEEVEAVNSAWKAGDRAGAVKGISERVLDGLGAVGPPTSPASRSRPSRTPGWRRSCCPSRAARPGRARVAAQDVPRVTPTVRRRAGLRDPPRGLAGLASRDMICARLTCGCEPENVTGPSSKALGRPRFRFVTLPLPGAGTGSGGSATRPPP
jgi:Luciferase-like monooxygenase